MRPVGVDRMGELGDTSLIFSLNQPFERERERVEREQREAEERQVAAAVGHAERERLQEEVRIRQAALEERRKREERERARAEQARLERLKTAEIERVRAEVQKHLELEQARCLHEHERRMAALRHDARLRRSTIALSATTFLSAALLIGAFAAYFGKLRPDRERLIAGYKALIDAERSQLHEARRHLLELEGERNRLRAEMQAARERETAPSNTKPAADSRKAPAGPPRPKPPRRQVGQRLDPHDPLNPEL